MKAWHFQKSSAPADALLVVRTIGSANGEKYLRVRCVRIRSSEVRNRRGTAVW